MSGGNPIDTLAEVTARYAVAITPAMQALIDERDKADPIAAQFLPDARELSVAADELADPIGDKQHTPVKGIVHRYPDRVLLKPLHVCPVYCRFCFRREVVGPNGEGALTGAELNTALEYISARPAIWEVILTGGDPFMLSPRRATEIATRLAAISHVKIVRWHTRVPCVDPARVTSEFVAALKAPGVVTYVALHANHPRELTAEARSAIARVIDAGIPMLSQSVLLRGVNDDVATLEALMRAFVECRIKPYYLHHLDNAPGTLHFRVDLEDGRGLVSNLRARISGVAMPAFVLDGVSGKRRIVVD